MKQLINLVSSALISFNYFSSDVVSLFIDILYTGRLYKIRYVFTISILFLNSHS